MHEIYVANCEFAIAKKNGAHFSGRPDYILGCTRYVAITLRTGRQSSDCSYFIGGHFNELYSLNFILPYFYESHLVCSD